MKYLVLLLAMLLSSMNCLAYSIEGDTDYDGFLSGEEQYLFENPDIGNATRDQVYRAIKKYKKRQLEIALWQEQELLNARKAAYKLAIEQAAYQHGIEKAAYDNYRERNNSSYWR